MCRAPTTLKSEREVTSLSGADKREVRDNREKSKYFSNCTTFHIIYVIEIDVVFDGDFLNEKLCP